MSHLAQRFLYSLRPGGPSTTDLQWALQHMTEPERRCFLQMYPVDQRHSIDVAKMMQASLDGTNDAANQELLAAALLHDVGKVDAGFGVIRRTLATLIMGLVGRARVARWSSRVRIVQRLAWYADHGPRGERALLAAGGRELPARWAGAHHQPAATWGALPIGRAFVNALDAADHGRVVDLRSDSGR